MLRCLLTKLFFATFGSVDSICIGLHLGRGRLFVLWYTAAAVIAHADEFVGD